MEESGAPRKWCDLHTHTNASDGSDTPAELVKKAVEAGLAAVGITDHDTVAGLEEALAAGRESGIEVIAGVELSVLVSKGNMHLLGYFVDPEVPSFGEVLFRVQTARSGRNPKILKKLKDLGLPVSMEELEEMAEGGQIGRPHIARAMVGHGYVNSVSEAFSHYLRTGAAAYVPKSILSPQEAITAVHQGKGLAVLAHPFSLGFDNPAELDSQVAAWVELGLDGIECYYSEHAPDFTRFCRKLCEKYSLVATGGSDYHGKAKPYISLGRGRGNLRIPYDCVIALKERQAARIVNADTPGAHFCGE